MNGSLMSSAGCRRGVRHQVELPCALVAQQSEAASLIWATDLSRFGAWVETREPLYRGEEVVLCVEPLWAWQGGELQIFAQVQRAERRLGALGRPTLGMAIEFMDLTETEARALSSWLAPRPRVAFSSPSAPVRRLQSLAPLLH